MRVNTCWKVVYWEGGRERGREGGREGGKEAGSEGGMEAVRDGGREAGLTLVDRIVANCE